MRRLLVCALLCAPLANACTAPVDDSNAANGLTGPSESHDAGVAVDANPGSTSGEAAAIATVDDSSAPASSDATPGAMSDATPDATTCVVGAPCTFPSGAAGVTACKNGVASCEQSCPATGCYTGGSGTPLVIAFHHEGVRFTDADGDFALFGVQAGSAVATRWVGAETPWIALDRNGNGSIDDGSELFGSMTELPRGGVASNGFVALAALDTDGDGKITARDARYGELLLWRDANQDRVSQPEELTRLGDEGIESIDLAYGIDRRCVDGDCEVERSEALVREGLTSGVHAAVIDVHFAARGAEPAIR